MADSGRFEAKLDAIAEELGKLTEAVLTGNGSPPLLSRVAVLEETIRKTAEAKTGFLQAFVWPLASSLIGATIMFAAVKLTTPAEAAPQQTTVVAVPHANNTP